MQFRYNLPLFGEENTFKATFKEDGSFSNLVEILSLFVISCRLLLSIVR